MLREADTPKRVVSQAPLKMGQCHAGCGKTITYRTTPRVSCEECKPSRKRASSAAAMERQRRKRGVPEVKGRTIRCKGCDCEVVLNRNATAKYCPTCYLVQNGKEARQRSERRRSTAEGRSAHNEWARRHRQKSPRFRLACHMRTMIHRGLGSGKAGRSWREFVPYTLDDLVRHLERQFLPGMTWANQGSWHIDHITPLRLFSYTAPADADFQAAWALTNLRPLWSLDNIRKSGRRTLLL